MKALFTLKSAINQSTIFGFSALIALIPAIYPEVALGHTQQTSGRTDALVFEIKDLSKLTADNSDQNQNLLTVEQLKNSDPLTIRLKAYLEKHKSPLAEYAAEIPHNPQWQRALAVSWVESNFGRFCADNNCSGIGVAPGHKSWRKYTTKLDWFKDMSKLMETPRYKEKFTTFEKMRGVYVQPGSDAWVFGAKKKYAELMALTTEAEKEKIALSLEATENPVSTFPQLAFAK